MNLCAVLDAYGHMSGVLPHVQERGMSIRTQPGAYAVGRTYNMHVARHARHLRVLPDALEHLPEMNFVSMCRL